jgi:uncharacterized UPF0160 family protein
VIGQVDLCVCVCVCVCVHGNFIATVLASINFQVGSSMTCPAKALCLSVCLQVYKNFIEAVDAVDNGVNQFDSDGPPK